MSPEAGNVLWLAAAGGGIALVVTAIIAFCVKPRSDKPDKSVSVRTAQRIIVQFELQDYSDITITRERGSKVYQVHATSPTGFPVSFVVYRTRDGFDYVED